MDRIRKAGLAVGAAARGAGRSEGHHRHPRHADRTRHADLCRSPAGRRRRHRRTPARGGRGDHGQDQDHRTGLRPCHRHHQPAQPGPHARRLVQRFGRCRGRVSGAAGHRHPDQRLGDPPGLVLRHLRVQADARRDLAPGAAGNLGIARSGRLSSAARWKTWPCWPTRSGSYDPADPASFARPRPAMLEGARADVPVEPTLRLVRPAVPRPAGRRRPRRRWRR